MTPTLRLMARAAAQQGFLNAGGEAKQMMEQGK